MKSSKRKTRSDKFPLTLNSTGQYCKKIKGRMPWFWPAMFSSPAEPTKLPLIVLLTGMNYGTGLLRVARGVWLRPEDASLSALIQEAFICSAVPISG